MGNEESINLQDISTKAYKGAGKFDQIYTPTWNYVAQDSTELDKLSYEEKCEYFCTKILNTCGNPSKTNKRIQDIDDIFVRYNTDNVNRIKHSDLFASIVYKKIRKDYAIIYNAATRTYYPEILKIIKDDQRVFRIVAENFQKDFDKNWKNEEFRISYIIIVPQTAYPSNLTEIQESLLIMAIDSTSGHYNKERVKYLYDKLPGNIEELRKICKFSLTYYQSVFKEMMCKE